MNNLPDWIFWVRKILVLLERHDLFLCYTFTIIKLNAIFICSNLLSFLLRYSTRTYEWGHPMRIKLTHEGLLVKLAHHYTTQDARPSLYVGYVTWDLSNKMLCCILTLDRDVNQRRTSVNKQKKTRKQVGVMKEYGQVPAAVELVGDWEARVRASLQSDGCGPQRPPVEQPQPRCGKSAAMVKRRI